MKKQYVTVLFTLICILGSGLGARAQEEDTVVTKVPFDFVVAGQVLPAATYRTSRVDPATGSRAQITKSILSFLGHKDRLCVLALDQFSLILDIAIQSGFNDQAAFKRTFHQFVGVSPGRRRRYYMTNHFRS